METVVVKVELRSPPRSPDRIGPEYNNHPDSPITVLSDDKGVAYQDERESRAEMDAEEYQDGGESRFGREGWEDRDEDEEDQEDEHEDEEDEQLATTTTTTNSRRQRLEAEDEEEVEPLATTV